MKRLRYDEPPEGEWIQPARRNHRLVCCDCGLVHKMDFRVWKNGRAQFRGYRAVRETARYRKQEGITVK